MEETKKALKHSKDFQDCLCELLIDVNILSLFTIDELERLSKIKNIKGRKRLQKKALYI